MALDDLCLHGSKVKLLVLFMIEPKLLITYTNDTCSGSTPLRYVTFVNNKSKVCSGHDPYKLCKTTTNKL